MSAIVAATPAKLDPNDKISSVDLNALPTLPLKELSGMVADMIPHLSRQELVHIASQIILNRKMQPTNGVTPTNQTTTNQNTTSAQSAHPTHPTPRGNTVTVPLSTLLKDPSTVTNKLELRWERHYQQLVQFKLTHGHCDVKYNDSNPQVRTLRRWVKIQRHEYAKNELRPDRIERLNVLGFLWRTGSYQLKGLSEEEVWWFRCRQVKEFYGQCGHLEVGEDYPCSKKLHLWMRKQRRLYQNRSSRSDRSGEGLTPEKIDALNEINFDWDLDIKKRPNVSREELWHLRYNQLKEFQREFGHCVVPKVYKGEGILLVWAGRQRSRRRLGKLSEERIRLLDEIGFHWLQQGLNDDKKEGMSKEGTVKEGTAKGETVKTNTVKKDTAKKDTAKKDTTKKDTTNEETKEEETTKEEKTSDVAIKGGGTKETTPEEEAAIEEIISDAHMVLL